MRVVFYGPLFLLTRQMTSLRHEIYHSNAVLSSPWSLVRREYLGFDLGVCHAELLLTLSVNLVVAVKAER